MPVYVPVQHTRVDNSGNTRIDSSGNIRIAQDRGGIALIINTHVDNYILTTTAFSKLFPATATRITSAGDTRVDNSGNIRICAGVMTYSNVLTTHVDSYTLTTEI
jgi:hypothetical protein